jgi:hypothetical protein
MPLPQILRLCLLSLTLLVGSCEEPEPEGPPLPADFSVRWGHGGGLSGQWSGRRVSPEGTLSRWSIAYDDGGEQSQVLGKLSERERRDLWNALDENGFFSRKAGIPLEWSSTIAATANGATHRVTWEPMNAELDRLYARLLQVSRRPNE